MKLSDLRDVFVGQDVYIVGSGPTSGVFPFEFLRNKVCIGLNDSYKIHDAITPITLMHHQVYARSGAQISDDFHPNFANIKYPVVKSSGRDKVDNINPEDPLFYTFDWSHEIECVYELTKDTGVLYYTPSGSALLAGLQLAWIVGARRVFVIGCDSTTFAGKHYASFDKNGFRDDETLKRGEVRDYDSYIKGTIVVQDFLSRKGVEVLNLSPLIGYHALDLQFQVLSRESDVSEIIDEFVSSKSDEGLAK